MTLDELNPPINVMEDFQAMQLVITDDRMGDKTRRMHEYFKHSEARSLEMSIRATDYEEKQFAQMLAEAFAAGARIVVASWERIHDTQLAL